MKKIVVNMVNFPNQDILSIAMKQKYVQSKNGTTYIRYYIDYDASFFKEIIPYMTAYELPNVINIPDLCDFEDDFKINSEGQFFVKKSSYKSDVELEMADILATEDDIRFKLYHGIHGLDSCPQILNATRYLADSYDDFYKSFVTESKSLFELFDSYNPNIDRVAMVRRETANKIYPIYTNYNSSQKEVIQERLEYSFKIFFENNANIVFIPTTNKYYANLRVYPIIDTTDVLPGDLPFFSEDVLDKMFLIFPLHKDNNAPSLINDYAHGLAHIFLDHPCENFYPCGKGSVQAKTYGIEYLTVMSQVTTRDISRYQDQDSDKFQIIQSLLPWDIAALRFGYGMPESKNTTYILNSVSNFEENFSVSPKNNTLVAFSSIGYNIINATSVKSYSIDLHYDILSQVEGEVFSFQFLMSYDTQINEIIVNSPGIINLNEGYESFIEIGDVDYYLSESDECLDSYCLLNQVQIMHFNPLMHSLCVERYSL